MAGVNSTSFTAIMKYSTRTITMNPIGKKFIFLVLVILGIRFAILKIINGSALPPEKKAAFIISKDGFVMNGEPFRYISGSLHYFRVTPSSWRDRLRKMKYAGLNAVQTYTLWASHEPEPGTYDFSGRLDLVKFIEIAHEEELFVILRPGPYIDAEVDMGGLPYWLLREDPNMKLRTSDIGYIKYVEKWMTFVLQKVKHLLFQNGGPIIMVQVENEYGSYSACDKNYTSFLRTLTKFVLGDDVVLFTTDGPSASYLECGKIADVYATVDFGTGANINQSFKAQRYVEPEGPLVNSEFYTGWLDHYGKPHSIVISSIFSYYLDEILSLGASVNMYVFNGGTSFGLLPGANIIERKFLSCPTSYDYDAPLNEAGDPTEKYYAIRNITQKYVKLPSGPVPPPSKKYSYGKVSLKLQGILPYLLRFLPTSTSNLPKTFEALGVTGGLVAYQTVIHHLTSDPSELTFEDVRDRGYVYVDNTYIGIVTRDQKIFTLGIFSKPNQVLTVIVESMGRVCFGEHINDWKGIGKVSIANIELEDWSTTILPLSNEEEMDTLLSEIRLPTNIGRTVMSFFDGQFEIGLDTPQDTFLRQDIWTKGYVWINGFLLGRYWPAVGPQMTLYVPGALLRNGVNRIRIFELEGTQCLDNGDCFVEFVSTPQLNGDTPFFP